MRKLALIAIASLALVGCSGPVIGDLDNHCIIEYLDGTREDIICSWASESKPVFRKVEDGAIVIKYHDLTRRSIPIKRVRSWRLRYGDTDHWGRYVKVNGQWVRVKAKGGAE